MKGAPIVAGSRVYLRHPTNRDAEEFLRLMRRSRSFLRPWVKPPLTEEAFGAQVRRCRGEQHFGALICLNDGGAITGVININEIVRGLFQSGYLGYYIAAPYAAQGYMSEGMRLLIGHAFKHLKLHRLEANIQPGNLHSVRLVRRLGFSREGLSPRYLKIGGRWRDHERWAMLAERWRAGSPGR